MSADKAGASSDPRTGTDRRTLLKRAGVAGAGAALASTAGTAGVAAASSRGSSWGHPSRRGGYLVPRDRIGVGLEVWGNAAPGSRPANIFSKLPEIHEIGYQATELFSVNGIPGGVAGAQQVGEQLEANEIVAVGSLHTVGFTPNNIRNALDLFIQQALAAGVRGIGMTAVQPDPANTPPTEAYYRSLAQEFNQWGKQCKRAGLTFYVHNEPWVFDRDPVTGKVLYDVWIEHTDARYVKFVLDTAWVSVRGFDPVYYLRKLERLGKLSHFHIKDWDGINNQPNPDLGAGVIDWERFFGAIEHPDRYWYILETEAAVDPTRKAIQAYGYLMNLKSPRGRWF